MRVCWDIISIGKLLTVSTGPQLILMVNFVLIVWFVVWFWWCGTEEVDLSLVHF